MSDPIDRAQLLDAERTGRLIAAHRARPKPRAMAFVAIVMSPSRLHGCKPNPMRLAASSARPYSSARRLSVWEFIVKNWGPLYALASLVGLVVIILLSKTYAKREDLTAPGTAGSTGGAGVGRPAE